MNTNFKHVVAEAKVHFFVNSIDIYVCWNDIDGYYYCDSKSLVQLNVIDNNKGLSPRVMGYWSYGLTTVNDNGQVRKFGTKYYELTSYKNVG